MVIGKVYNKIKHHINTFTAWDLLASMFKSWETGFLIYVFRRLDPLTLKDYKNTTDYITKFCTLVNELCNFSSEFKIDNNFFIYKF